MIAREKRERLGQVGEAVDGVRRYQLGDALDPPSVHVTAPVLTWDTPGSEPSSGVFTVVLVVPADDRALDLLDELVPLVVAAIDADVDLNAAVRRAEPGTWDVGGQPLPCYFIETEVS